MFFLSSIFLYVINKAKTVLYTDYYLILIALLIIIYPTFQLSTPLVLLEKLMPSLTTVRLSIAKGAA